MISHQEATPTACRRTSAVRFSETSRLIVVPNLSATPAKPDLWFTQEEMDEFKSSTKRRALVVRHHIARGRIPSANHVLGFEKFLTPELEEEYRVRRRQAAASILTEAPAALEEDDLHRLARASAARTRWARRQARAAGLFLEQDVEDERMLECSVDAAKTMSVEDGGAMDVQVCVPC
ncbi:hypothetical protein ACHAWF_009921 [Thalassiosira exigua]